MRHTSYSMFDEEHCNIDGTVGRDPINQFIENIDIAIEAFLQYLNGTIFGYKFL